MNNFISKELVDAGRYEHIVCLANDIISTLVPAVKYPLPMNGDHDERVCGSDVIAGLTMVVKTIYDNETDDAMKQLIHDLNVHYGDYASMYLLSAQQYVDSCSKMHLHNYAIEISHHNRNHAVSMENIRCWLILGSVITAVQQMVYNDREEDESRSNIEFKIPEGWRAVGECDWMDPNQVIDHICSDLQNLKSSLEERR